jgi:hypothetical protein
MGQTCPMSHRRTLVVPATLLALLSAGSAASAIPSPPGAGPRPGKPREVVVGRVAFRPATKGFPNPRFPVVRNRNTATSKDAFGKLDGAAFAAYGSGTVFHTDPELNGTDVAATVDMATADAVYAGQGLTGFADELRREIIPNLQPGSGQAQARSLNIVPSDAIGDVPTGQPAVAKAPPTSRPVVKESDVDAEPFLKVSALRSEASARAVSTGCVIGRDLARGAASADDTKVTDTDPSEKSTKPLLSLSADDPPRAVSQSTSVVRLVPIPGRPGRFGAIAETRQTIAPITFGLPGTDEKFTIEVGGEWVMRAATDGTKGLVTFGPKQGVDGDRPAIRLIHGDDVIDEVGIREEGGRTGIFLDGDPIGDIRIGGDRRAISGQPGSKPTETPTRVSAASDVVVVRLFEPRAELRVGHMEVGLAVPPGGVQCPGIQMTKTSEPASVQPGDPFSWNIDVVNPNDCALEKVKVTDTPTGSPGVVWRAVSSLPRAVRAPDGSLVFDEIGPMEAGDRKTLEINAVVEPGSAFGRIANRVAAVGECGGATLGGSAETTTTVGAGIVPEPRQPPFGLKERDKDTGDRSAESAALAAEPAEPTGPSGPNMASASAKRSSSASATTARSNQPPPRTSASAAKAQAERSAAGALARSGTDSIPYLALALSLLGTGRLLRRVRPRR